MFPTSLFLNHMMNNFKSFEEWSGWVFQEYGLCNAPVFVKYYIHLNTFFWMSFPVIRSSLYPRNLTIRIKRNHFSSLLAVLEVKKFCRIHIETPWRFKHHFSCECIGIFIKVQMCVRFQNFEFRFSAVWLRFHDDLYDISHI